MTGPGAHVLPRFAPKLAAHAGGGRLRQTQTAAYIAPARCGLFSLHGPRDPNSKEMVMLWALGLITSFTAGGLIHILLVVALIMIVVNLISGRRAL
jgi:hypothetical protein